MYSLRLRCGSDDAEELSFQLWEAGTLAISESSEDGVCVLTAGFADAQSQSPLLKQFAGYAPDWREDKTDWVAVTKRTWPARAVGDKLFLAPPWCEDDTPAGRVRLVHNPGRASGTGEHPCTQLALEALERITFAGCRVLDVGTGSGMLAIASLLLGAEIAIGVDPDEDAIRTAWENFYLNSLQPTLVTGSVECTTSEYFDITVANISATVLLSIADDLLRVTTPKGVLILTGFPHTEAGAVCELLPGSTIAYSGDWACVTTKLS